MVVCVWWCVCVCGGDGCARRSGQVNHGASATREMTVQCLCLRLNQVLTAKTEPLLHPALSWGQSLVRDAAGVGMAFLQPRSRLTPERDWPDGLASAPHPTIVTPPVTLEGRVALRDSRLGRPVQQGLPLQNRGPSTGGHTSNHAGDERT